MHVAEAAHSGNGKSLGGTLAIASARMMHDAEISARPEFRFHVAVTLNTAFSPPRRPLVLHLLTDLRADLCAE
jgi:hypothetical protein